MAIRHIAVHGDLLHIPFLIPHLNPCSVCDCVGKNRGDVIQVVDLKRKLQLFHNRSSLLLYREDRHAVRNDDDLRVTAHDLIRHFQRLIRRGSRYHVRLADQLMIQICGDQND